MHHSLRAFFILFDISFFILSVRILPILLLFVTVLLVGFLSIKITHWQWWLIGEPLRLDMRNMAWNPELNTHFESIFTNKIAFVVVALFYPSLSTNKR